MKTKRVWIEVPYLESRLKEMINVNELMNVISKKNELEEGINYTRGKIEAYKNVLEWLQEKN